jgi:DNA-binding PadR family transcriptional regulator
MLTKAGLLILGIIDEKPLNPYEIIKQMDNLIIKELFPISVSSVYTTIRNLSDKGYISGKRYKGVNLPDKTVYSITKEGEAELKKSILEYMESIDFDPIKIHIAGFMIYYLKKDEAVNVLLRRIQKFEDYRAEINKKLKHLMDNGLVPDIVLTIIKHNLKLIEAELQTANELLQEVQRDNSWA